MINWVKALRLKNGILLAAPMTLLGFHLVGHSVLEGLPYALVAFVIYSATIVWNDYCDRNIDCKKGKTFAHDNAKKFLVYSIGWWLKSVVCACWLWWAEGLLAGLLAFSLIALGILYTEAEKNAFTKNGTVAIWSSSLLLFPLAKGHTSTPAIWWLFTSAALINCGREVLKDVEDRRSDGTAKGTLAKLLGMQKAVACGCCLLLLGAGLAIVGLRMAGLLITPFCVYGATLALKGRYTLSVQILKLGMIFFLITLFL